MLKSLLSILFSFTAPNLYCQPQWQLIPKIERNDFYTFEGSIDNKYPILMYIAYTGDYCGSNDNDKWNPRIVKGWYQYKKIGKKIPLIGSLHFGDMAEYGLKFFVPINLMDTLHHVTCTLDKYKEMFFMHKRHSIDTMQWIKYGQDTFLYTYLITTHAASWQTNATLSFEVDGIDLLKVNLSEVAKNLYIDKIEVEAASYIEGQFYFILRFGHMTNPGFPDSGYCGSGWEEWLVFMQISNALQVAKFDYFQTESCYTLIDVEYTFNKEHPEFGIIKKKNDDKK
jgi:hypothetical protein